MTSTTDDIQIEEHGEHDRIYGHGDQQSSGAAKKHQERQKVARKRY